MKQIPPLILILLIATTLNIVECSLVNITLKCQVSSSESCLSDNDGCGVVCNMTSGLNYTTLTEVQGLDIDKDVKLEQIKSLVIKPFDMTENLPQRIGEKLTNLEKLEVVGSKLMYIRNEDFKGMTKLKVLNLGANKIKNFKKDTFENLTKLELLFLYGNEIDYLLPQTLYKLTSLREFHVDMNQIERIDDNFFKNNLKIEKISLNENKLVYFKENFTRLENLKFVDLRRNSHMCTACNIMEQKAREKRFNNCEREKFDQSAEKMKNFEECVKIKISEKDELLKKFNGCSTFRDAVTENITKHFETCVKIKGYPIRLDNIRTIDSCIFSRIKSENEASKDFEKCVDLEISKDKEWTQLVTNCNTNRTIEASAIQGAYSSCMYCKVMGDADNVKMCELRYAKDYNDDLNEFVEDVTRFFGNK
ncbi:hypothetical protein ACKWTF_015376 [Chironomus riparius]